MIALADITNDIYLCLHTSRLGYPAGLIGIVHAVGRDWGGNWYFHLRDLNSPVGRRNNAVSGWRLNHDLEDFERIETWKQV